MNVVKIGLCSDACEPISFELGLMINTTELYIEIPLCKTLTFTQGHRGRRKLERVRSFSIKVA